jgi:hypothetical protein
LQLQIAERGLRLVKYGGILVYSTCSLSPYGESLASIYFPHCCVSWLAEDEAVVAQLLRANKDTLELIDAREFIPHFNCRPGLSQWLVLDDSRVPRRDKARGKKGEETNESKETNQPTEEEEKSADTEARAENDDGDGLLVLLRVSAAHSLDRNGSCCCGRARARRQL